MLPRIPFIDFDDDSPSDAWSKWFMGIVVPVAIASYGLSGIVERQFTLYGRRGIRRPLTGWDAVAGGMAVISIAVFLHARYFMAHSTTISQYTELAKVAALLTGIGSIGFIFVRGFMLN